MNRARLIVFKNNFIEYPQYTRPAEYNGEKYRKYCCREIQKIKEWQQQQSGQRGPKEDTQ